MEGQIEAIGRIVSRASRLRQELDGLNNDLAHLGATSQTPSRHLDCRGFLLPLGRRTLIMGSSTSPPTLLPATERPATPIAQSRSAGAWLKKGPTSSILVARALDRARSL